MTYTNQKGLTAEEQLTDLTVKYEAIEHELKVLKLENMEYRNDIEELKETNSHLMEQIASYQEILDFEQQQISFTHTLSVTLDDLNTNNVDLHEENKEYQHLLKQLKLENISLKTENNKYKLALEQYSDTKQKREELYISNKLDLENKIKALNIETESLRTEIATMSSSFNNISVNLNKTNQETDDIKQYEPTTPYKEDTNKSYPPSTPYGVLRLKYMDTRNGISNHNQYSNQRPLFVDVRSADVSATTTPRTDFFEHMMEHPKIEQTPAAFSDFGIDEDGNIDCGYSHYKSVHNGYEFSKKSTASNDDICHISIKQSTTNEFDADLLLAKIDEIYKLKEANNDYESHIKELEDEIKILKQQNHQLIEKLDTGFRCVALQWFS